MEVPDIKFDGNLSVAAAWTGGRTDRQRDELLAPMRRLLETI